MTKADEILSKFSTPDWVVKRTFANGSVSGEVVFQPDICNGESIWHTLKSLGDTGENFADLQAIKDKNLFTGEVVILSETDMIINKILSGDTAVFFNGFDDVLIVNTRMWDKRAIMEPGTEIVVAGPREGFIEDIKTNLSLIARRLKSPNLAVERMVIGRQGAVNVAVVYMSNIAKKSLADKIIKKLKNIDIDTIFDASNLEPFLEEKPYSIFRQCGATERPDVAAAKILEGRIAVIVDGSPTVLTLPHLFVEDFYASEDYYQRNTYASFIRLMRFSAIVLALLLPGIFVAIQMYNYSIIPTRLLITIMDAVRGTPLSPLSEMIFVLLLFELIREASIRMPRPVGTAMSIVSALVLGDTAVKAGILSAPSIMFSALSSIALFVSPRHIESFSLLRLIITLAGGLLGLYGIILATVFIVHYLAGLNSYEASYLAPLAPLTPSDFQDGITKNSILDLEKRPLSIPNHNGTRQGE